MVDPVTEKTPVNFAQHIAGTKISEFMTDIIGGAVRTHSRCTPDLTFPAQTRTHTDGGV
ncbi:hypothetical protein [Streptomyces sp. BV286]|uniref:hypothetical protein n=1 Tax=unclassified Streptomyces TaxID=2593676 RepID=UPI001C2E4163|nr:hypothetical protein [Streptomyces sp. BV286]MBV1940510.1 hypothetical protein [Streptomyces sp. BV286]